MSVFHKYIRNRRIIIIFMIIGSLLLTIVTYRVATQKNKNNLRYILPVSIERLEQQLFQCINLEEVKDFLQKNDALRQDFLAIETNEDEEKISQTIYNLLQNNEINKLYDEVKEKFKDITKLEKDLSTVFKHLKYYYPDWTPPKVVTMVTGLSKDIYVGPRLIVIGLDCFLGEGASIRPQLPQYLLKTYEERYILPKIALLLAETMNEHHPSDHTLLHDILHEGKAYYLCKAILPDVEKADIIGYTAAQWKDTQEHRAVVWQHFIDNELFYVTNHIVKKKYIGPRPFTSEIGPGCPGNIGGWLGWQSINKYMKEHKQVTLPQLMKETNLQKLFIEARYKPTK